MSEGTVDSWKKRLQDILQRWAPENIWNIDETAQFFRALPGHVVARAESLTCAFFVNSSGVKEKPIVIRKSENPRCLMGIANKADLPCRYFNQPKAWMKQTS